MVRAIAALILIYAAGITPTTLLLAYLFDGDSSSMLRFGFGVVMAILAAYTAAYLMVIPNSQMYHEDTEID